MKTALTKTTILASLLVVASAWIMQSCSGDKGDKGDTGATGAASPGCTAASNPNGVTITCGSDVYTLTNGEKGDKGESSCTVTNNLTDPETGLPAVGLNCGDGMKYIVQGGGSVTGNIDCKLIVPEDDRTMGQVIAPSSSSAGVYTGINSKGPRQIFGIQCGGENGAIAQIGFCGANNDVFNPKTEKCIESTTPGVFIIVPGIGKCKLANGTIQEYTMSEQFCQDATGGSSLDQPYDEDTGIGLGSILQPVCSGAGTYSAFNFCYGYEKGKSAGVIAAKCGGAAASPEFATYQFCQSKGSPATYSVVTRCGMSATQGPTSAQLNGGTTGIPIGVIGNGGNGTNGAGAYTSSEFCQDETNLILSLCGGKAYTKEQTCLPENQIGGLCGELSYNMSRSFCATQDTKIYALCGSTSDEGKFNPTTSFCWSGDFSTSNTDSANTYGQIRNLCNGVASISSSSSAVDTTWKLQGYYTSQFCSAQNDKIYDLCGQKTAYNTDNYFCTKTGAIQWDGASSSSGAYFGTGSSASATNVLSGKCVDGNLTNPYNLSRDFDLGLTCSTNKVYRACYGGDQNTALPLAYDGPSVGVVTDGATNDGSKVISVGYVGTASQVCTSASSSAPNAAPAVRCRTATGNTLVPKDGTVGCVCDISTDNGMDLPQWNPNTGACVACVDVWSPADNGGRGACVSDYPVNSQSGKKGDGTTDNNIAVCKSGSWKIVTDADITNQSDAIYQQITSNMKGKPFCH